MHSHPLCVCEFYEKCINGRRLTLHEEYNTQSNKAKTQVLGANLLFSTPLSAIVLQNSG